MPAVDYLRRNNFALKKGRKGSTMLFERREKQEGF